MKITFLLLNAVVITLILVGCNNKSKSMHPVLVHVVMPTEQSFMGKRTSIIYSCIECHFYNSINIT